jgi:septum formation protein
MSGASASGAEAERSTLVLASSSPQRRAILERLGVEFVVRPSSANELDRGDPGAIPLENALAKARLAYSPGENETVLGCDTVVSLAGVIYGKPPDEHAARETLRALSGERHEVVSGLALLGPGAGEHPLTTVARTAVTFRELGEDQLEWYLATGEWRGRAGGYAIQGAGAALVRRVEGDYENVVGLPLAALLDIYPELLNR